MVDPITLHAHAFMVLDTMAGEDEESLVFRYPRGGAADETERLKGLLVALHGLALGLTGQVVRVASLESHSTSTPVKAVYGFPSSSTLTNNRFLFILLLPGAYADEVAIGWTEGLLELMAFTLGPLDDLFQDARDTGVQEKLRHRLDPLVGALFVDLNAAMDGDGFSVALQGLFSWGVWYSNSSLDVQAKISQQLTRLEASSRQQAEQLKEDARVCFITSTALFHRGLLIHSHMAPTDLLGVTRYLHLHHILQRGADSPQFVSWRDVYVPAVDEEGVPSRERRILVMIGQGEDVLVLLLFPRAEPEGELDPYYLTELRETLQNLQSSGVLALLNAQMSEPNPPLIEDLAKHGPEPPSQGCRLTTGIHNTLFNYISYHNMHCTLISPGLDPRRPSPFINSLHHGFLEACLAIRRVLRHWKDKGCTPVAKESEGGDPVSIFATGATGATGSRQPKLLRHADDTPFLVHPELEPFRSFTEYGVRLRSRVGDDNEGQLFNYWVVGGVHAPYGETYVCFRDDVPQCMVELAFKLRFGTYP